MWHCHHQAWLHKLTCSVSPAPQGAPEAKQCMPSRACREGSLQMPGEVPSGQG
jgi:hypothetical protein